MDITEKTKLIQESTGADPIDGIWGNITANAVIAALEIEVPAEPDMWFGGVAVQPLGDWQEPALATGFGGKHDGDDSGVGAWDNPTGDPDGDQGCAVPQAIIQHLFPGSSKSEWRDLLEVEAETTDGTKARFDLVDLGPGESIFERNGCYVLDLTEGAIRQLGGEPLYNSSGQFYGFSGFTLKRCRILKKRGNIC